MDPYIDSEALDPAHPFTAGKLENYRRACLTHETRSETVEALPVKLTLQTTDACNLSCPHCQLPRAKKRAQMPWRLVERVASELFPNLIELHPTNLGEPLCWPHFRRLCQRMAEDGVLLDLTTNGTMLTPDRIEWFAPIIRDVKVSFDGASALTFERYRCGARFEQACDVVRALVKRLCRVRVRRPVVALQMTLMRSNLAELPAMVRLASELGADRVRAYHLFSFSDDMDAESLMPSLEGYRAILEEALTVGGELGIDLQLAEPPLAQGEPVVLSPSVCHLPWHESWIDYDGAVFPCHSHAGQVAGRLREATFTEIWNGPLYREIRGSFALGNPGWHCRNCGMNLAKGQEHEPVPYDPMSFLHSEQEGAERFSHPSAVRWSGRMKPFDLVGRRHGDD